MFEEKVRSFLVRNGLVGIISFSGGILEKHEKKLDKVLFSCMEVLSEYPFAILTGGTKWNLPYKAFEVAKGFGLPVIGVLPERARKHKIEGLDLELIVPSLYGDSCWGDETQLFVKLSSGMVLIGGGPGAAIEIFQSIKINQDRIDHGKQPIFIAPIAGFGGVEELIYKAPCFLGDYIPFRGFRKGEEAAEFLIKKLSLK